MEILIERKLKMFNPSLHDKAVHIFGTDIDGGNWNRTFLVMNCSAESLTLVNNDGHTVDVNLENFVEGKLKMTILEAREQ